MNKQSALEIIIFGASSPAQREAAKLLKDARFNLLGFYDNDNKKWGTSLLGKPVQAPEPMEFSQAQAILIGSSLCEPITQQLKGLGYTDKIAHNYSELLAWVQDKPKTQHTQSTEAKRLPEIEALVKALSTQQPYERTKQLDHDDTIAVTVCANNHITQAYVLARSFLNAHPQSRVIICIADERDSAYTYPDKFDARIEVIEARELNIPEFKKFSFQYTTFELCRALKAYALQYALSKSGVIKLLYLDADALVLAPFSRILDLLDAHNIVLTPHRHSIPKHYEPAYERDIMLSGVFNAGFLAIRVGPVGQQFLTWWAERLYKHCLINTRLGYFVDQRWLDYLPEIFDGVHILREPGVNAAVWNADGNPIKLSKNKFLVGENIPLVFYHFSKVSHIDTSQSFTMWMPILPPSEDLHLLVSVYRALIKQAHAQTHGERNRGWAYSRFSNGVYIPQEVRKLLRTECMWNDWDDPFDASATGTFWAWLNAPVMPDISPTNVFAYIDNPDNGDTVFSLAPEDRAKRACAQFMHCAKSGNPHALDPIFYKNVLERRSNCPHLTDLLVAEIPEYFLKSVMHSSAN